MERELAGPEHLDPSYVATYDRKAGFDPAPDLEGLEADDVVVDLGAGTGTFALAAAQVCKRVVAVDVSPAMIAVLRDRAALNVEVVEAGFLTYEHRGEPPTVVYSRHALHHLPDLWKAVALARIAALLAPGGRFQLRDLVFSYAPDEADARIAEWTRSGADDPSEGWTPAELETHVREEFSTYTWLLEPMLERAGFEIVSAEYVRGAYANYVCTLAA
jgi:SAM-dependent methyltransferase